MAKKMLIDATHPEETRVVVVDGTKVEEFDFESLSKRQLAGNIYLAKVTRVEPSLQAAFVDYGGNRHGFLAFSEIHPDYYQIPVADREALLAEEREYAEAMAAEAEEEAETVADDDTEEDIRPVRKPRPRKYKIQEVVKVRQIMLVQVVKEERGNKGAALTTYLSLAGRYCVLMPNTARGGGISRKITNAADRKKLKEIATELDVPQGAGLIVRTAGAKRTKTEIKRDYEYLQRQWEQVRELTLKSVAPALIYQEGDLIHRTIRDLYNRDIDEVLVEGEAGYRRAKDFMKMIMPSHAKNVKHYTDPMPIFAKYKVEGYLADMFNPVVQLKSGGYIVIGVTEALVAIDVNSGRATKEGSIEETATKTNLEAAEEVARQLRLRDLAGLIVIDFIDMDERRNNAVEKR
jgi:ribonuclease E